MSGGIDVSVSLSQIMDVASQDTPVSFVGVAMQVVFDEYQGGHDEHQGALVEYNGDHDEHQGDHEVLDGHVASTLSGGVHYFVSFSLAFF